jgi:hypothetical protein
VIKFVSDLRQVGGFLLVLRYPKTAFAGNKNLFGGGLGEKLIDFPQHGTEAEIRATILRYNYL